MSENIDGAGRRSPGPRLLVRPLLLFASVALVIGFVASRTDDAAGDRGGLLVGNAVHPASQLTPGERKIGIFGRTNVSPISRRAMRSGVSCSAAWKRSIGS
jgi:hypothetical protein